MLEPDELPAELQALERDLSQPAGEDISDELRARVMTEVRMTIRRESSNWTVRQRTLVAVGSLAAVAALALVTLRLRNDAPQQRQASSRQATISNDEEIESAPLPTFVAYRLSPGDSPDDWQTLIDRRTEAFMVDHDEQTLVIAWNDQISMLELAD